MIRAFSIALLVGMRATASAQLPEVPPPSAAPEVVVTAFLAHMQAHDWSGAAAYFDPAEVTRLSDTFHRFSALPGAEAGLAQGLGISATDFQALTPAGLFAQFLAVGARANPDVFEAMKQAKYQILGQVPEDSTQVHLVLRGHMTLNGIEVSATELRSFRRTADGWRLQMPPEMQGIIMGLEAALNQAH